jgi:DNA-binding MarR family transcriptional regulator
LKKPRARPARKSAKDSRLPSASEGIVEHPLENMIGNRLRLAYNVQLQRFASVGGSMNIRPTQFAVLKLAYYNPNLKQIDLTNILNKKHANIVTLLDELEERALITRVQDRIDKRSRVLHLTIKGKALTKKLLARHALLDRDLDRALGPLRRKQLEKLLDQFLKLDPDPDIDKLRS